MDINDLRRKLHLGLRSLQLSALTSIKTDATRRPPQHAWDKTSPVSLLWDALLPTDDAPSSPFLAAASGDAVIYLVRKGGLDWQKSLNQVLARLATVSTPALPYVVRVVAQLLILHVESHMKDASAYKSPFGQKTRRPHPLITAVVRRPDAWSDVLFEVQDMFAAATRSNNVTTLRMLDPFIRFACLETAMDPVSGPGQYQAARMLLNLFLSILLSLPVVPGEAMITQTVLCDHIVGLVRKLPDAESHTRAICQLLNWTFDCRQSGRSLSVPLRSLQSYFATCGLRTMDTAMPPIIFAALSYCLLDVAEYPNQGTVLITLMLDIVKLVDVQEAVMQTIAPVAVLPLLQTLSEMTDSPVKRKVFDILVILERAVLRTSSLESDLGKSVRAISDHATGSFAVLVGDLQTLMLSYSLGSPEDGVLKGGDPHRSAFLYAGLIFHSEESTRIRALSACTSVSFPSASGYMSMLPLLLYVLKNDPSPHVQIHVLLKSLPALTAANDAFVTARVMHVVQSLLGDSAGSAGTNTLFCVGIRTLLEIWKRQPRVWPQLKGYLLAWAKRRRHGRPLRFHQGGQWSDEAEMETTVAATMRDVCLVRAADCGQDLLPHLFALLQAPELHTMTTVFALQSVNLCIEANITDPRAAWNVFMQQFVARTGSSPAAPGVLQQLCEFYRLVAVKDDQSELYMTLKSEILVSWLLPLMQHTEQNVREACFRAIAAYPAPDLFPVMSSPRELVTSIAAFTQPSPAAADMLANFVEHECKHMRRAVFKGFAAAAGGRLAEDYVSDESKGLQRVIRDVTAELRGLWEGGRAPAGLRSGLAAFSLMSTPSQDSHEGPSTDAKLPFHRSLTNSLRDFSLADHPTFRLEAVPVWTRFWDSALLAAYRKSRTSDPQSSLQAEGEKEKQQRIQDVEQMLAASVAELMEKRLPESHLPSAYCWLRPTSVSHWHMIKPATSSTFWCNNMRFRWTNPPSRLRIIREAMMFSLRLP
ncbi:hypothetical protein DFJ77DRAFT_258799 [Powellomyces hirtus]|nr:hypothetical protein DFJ77DRAFT_258799 [Powellomyces hirtus]